MTSQDKWGSSWPIDTQGWGRGGYKGQTPQAVRKAQRQGIYKVWVLKNRLSKRGSEGQRWGGR